jgi:hypothetical protein
MFSDRPILMFSDRPNLMFSDRPIRMFSDRLIPMFSDRPIPFCSVIGADILDKTSQNAFTFGRLKEEPSWYQLEESQQQHFEEVRQGTLL